MDGIGEYYVNWNVQSTENQRCLVYICMWKLKKKKTIHFLPYNGNGFWVSNLDLYAISISV